MVHKASYLLKCLLFGHLHTENCISPCFILSKFPFCSPEGNSLKVQNSTKWHSPVWQWDWLGLQRKESAHLHLGIPGLPHNRYLTNVCGWTAGEYKHYDGSKSKLATECLPLRTRPSTFPHAHFQETRNSIYMETSMTSTTPAGINSPVLFGRPHARCWPKGKDEKGRGWKAAPNNLAGSAGSTNPSPIDQIVTEQHVERKGSGKCQPHTRMLLRIQATAAHRVTLPGAVSWGSAVPHPH